jgi:hypothetical protein
MNADALRGQFGGSVADGTFKAAFTGPIRL